jgi:UTP--glucose-1-phosphate uridylyltransferase
MPDLATKRGKRNMKIKKAVIPAAGYGTRFLPATKSQPKEMLPIIDKPAIQFIVEEAVAAGIEQILIITNSQKSSILNHFDRSLELEAFLEKKEKYADLKLIQDISDMVEIYSVRQKEQKGLGHAILCAKAFVGNEPFAVLLGDDIVVNSKYPAIKQLCDYFETVQSSIVGVQPVPSADVSKYGIVKPVQKTFTEGTDISDIIEKPDMKDAPSNLAVLGRYVLTPSIFPLLETQAPGKGGEIQLTDSIKRQLETEKVYAFQFQGKRYDIGSKIGFLEATVDFALAREDINKEFKAILKSKF